MSYRFLLKQLPRSLIRVIKNKGDIPKNIDPKDPFLHSNPVTAMPLGKGYNNVRLIIDPMGWRGKIRKQIGPNWDITFNHLSIKASPLLIDVIYYIYIFNLSLLINSFRIYLGIASITTSTKNNFISRYIF